MVALIYNWWNLFVRCAQPERAREAITSRPLLLHAVGRIVTSGRQTVLRLTSHHAEAPEDPAPMTPDMPTETQSRGSLERLVGRVRPHRFGRLRMTIVSGCLLGSGGIIVEDTMT
jgi:hypothetical protein